MRRRTFLKALVGLGLFGIVTTGVGYRYRQRLLRRYTELSLDESSDKGTLSQDEFRVIRAVSEVISAKPVPPAEELLEFLNFRTSNLAGYYREYKDAASLFESRARSRFGKGFAALEEDSRETILRSILLEGPVQTGQPVIYRKIQTAFRVLSSRGEKRFKKFVFPDLVMFYWSSSAGWAAVGYSSYPGIANPPRAYTTAPQRATTRSLS